MRLSLPDILVLALMAGYFLFFSVYSLQRHAALASHAADLSFIDQPMWNTLHGRFLERTMDDRQVSRIAEHLEPIILIIAPIYYLWDDVRAILIIQSLALALGALPVYWIARRALANPHPDSAVRLHPREIRLRGAVLPLSFVVAYLMFPALQAANVADFHADPLIVAPLLFAFWYASERRYGRMWGWAALAMLVKENLPTLTFALGLFLFLWGGHTVMSPESPEAVWHRRLHAAALMLISLAWYGIATWLIVAPLARHVYGTPGPVYMAHRYTWFEDGFAGLWTVLSQPERLRYMLELFAPVGWLALLAPEYLLLGLPVGVANFLSDFPAQYSGQQHYTAPLVPAMIIAAIYGTRRLLRWVAGCPDDQVQIRRGAVYRSSSSRDADVPLQPGSVRCCAFLVACSIWTLGWSVGFHMERGWTPLARNFQWPQITAHHRLLGRFIAQIPPAATVSTTPPLHPHLAHREKIYLYPTVADAEYVLLDIASRTDAHPNDVYKTFQGLIESGRFTIVDAADGYILLARTDTGVHGARSLPDAFYDFLRVGDDRHPQFPLRVEFAPPGCDRVALRLVGYDLVDDPIWQQTGVRLYWQALAPLPARTRLWPFFYDDAGVIIEDTTQRPMVASIWYPPARWRPGELIITETLPWQLGARFHIGVAVVETHDFQNWRHRFCIRDAEPVTMLHHRRTWVQIGSFRRDGQHLAHVPERVSMNPMAAVFANGIRLVGYRHEIHPGMLIVVLAWRADAPVQEDYTVFVHLVTSEGHRIAQSDAQPHWGAVWPTSHWQPGELVLDGHRLKLPMEAPRDDLHLEVGLYLWPSLQRLPVLGADAQPISDHVEISLALPAP
ncbi:MAG: DUF2079 domain-containing protein [Anaerolineae bacterium]|nr:DUF2079 domain-containing protein [Anaerolineae bacterium]